MLKSLTVSNLAVVEHAEASFDGGLNVITGETGAGKSVLMGALGLVLGERADASVVRDGAKEAEVEAAFDGLNVRRTVTAQGRSRAWIDDESVSIAELKERTSRLVDIHGPRSNQLLLDEGFQRETLDAFGAASARAKGKKAKAAASDPAVAKESYERAYDAWRAARGRVDALSGAGATEDELDLLRYQVGELREAALTEEDETLAERHAAAAHAEELVEAANEVTEALGGDDSLAERLIRLQPRFAAMAKHLGEAADWSAQAEELSVRLQELSRSVADRVSRLDAGEEDLEELDRRLTLVNRLRRKYGARTGGDTSVAALLEIQREKEARLETLSHRDEQLAEAQQELAAAEKALEAAGAALTARRRASAQILAKAITGELRDLGFAQAVFFVTLAPAPPERHGCDRVTYMFGPNPGESARPLAAIASSGEIARVMLAAKGVLAAYDAAETLVFDEIDANVGGEIGRVVGEKMRGVAAHRQVIAITHLPQSAVYGARHLVVAKRVSGGRTRTEIRAVEGAERATEIARMLGGETSTGVVRKHAEELLSLSR